MLLTFSNYWWLFVFRGVLGILFGVAAFVYPNVALITLLYFFAAFVLVEGSFITVASLDFRKNNESWWFYLLAGAAGVAMGALTLFNPDATTTWLLALASGWSLAIGVMGTVAALRLRKEWQKEWALSLGSFLSILFGGFLVVRPEASDLIMVWIVGAFTLLFGVMMLTFGLKIKNEAMKAAKELVNVIR